MTFQLTWYKFLKASLMLTFVFGMFSHAKADSYIGLGLNLSKALKKVHTFYTDLAFVEQQIEDIKRGNQPEAKNDSWKTIVDKAEKLSKEIDGITYDTKFDESQFSVSLEEVMHCHLRSEAFQKMTGYQSKLKTLVSEATEVEKQLGVAIDNSQKAIEATIRLKKAAAEMSSNLMFKDYFAWNWFDLETKVGPALAKIRDSLRRKSKSVLEVKKIAAIRLDNYGANFELIKNSDCLLVGTWKGVMEQPSVRLEISIEVKGAPKSYGVIVTFLQSARIHQACNLVVSIPNRALSFNTECDNMDGTTVTWESKFDSNYARVDGTVSYLSPSFGSQIFQIKADRK
jgi:hypothetical protein